MAPDALQRFFQLLNEAHAASEAVDAFDLHSEDQDSVTAWLALLARQTEAVRVLIGHVNTQGDETLRIMTLQAESALKGSDPMDDETRAYLDALEGRLLAALDASRDRIHAALDHAIARLQQSPPMSAEGARALALHYEQFAVQLRGLGYTQGAELAERDALRWRDYAARRD